MIFKTIKRDELANLYAKLAQHLIVGPVRKGLDKNNKAMYDFDRVDKFADLCLDYDTTKHSAKKYFLPFTETLCTFKIFKDSWHKKVDYNINEPIVMFGLHPCDINAFNKLDKVLLEGVYPTPYYAAKRKNIFIIGVDCQPQPWCFCRSMDTDTVLHGFDLFLTDLGDRYFIEINTATAYEILQQLDIQDPAPQDHQLFLQKTNEKADKFIASVDTTDLTKILDMEFQSPVWQEWGDRCLSCGTCANVCPTCYCYGVEEEVDLDLKNARKNKHSYSCNLIDFAEVAGGHNFRPESHTRLKYRYYHKHRGFVEAFEESLCVGCGRCGQACLADINVPEVIASVRQEKI
ncbi:MAG: 4Fe-4S dicluster domain-containing protein [Desulfobulbaceae bacterium]|nr:4Fe-4S dicluster domain-containing protein [Desulfobulbaceae bacterium]